MTTKSTLDPLKISLLGGFALQLGDEPVKLGMRKAEALLADLVYKGQAVPREALVDLLWSDTEHPKALANLRVALNTLRKHLDAYLVIDRLHIGLQADALIVLDVNQIQAPLQDWLQHANVPTQLNSTTERALQQALHQCQGAFLQDFSIPHAPQFDDWVSEVRLNLQPKIQQALDRWVRYLMRHGRDPQALDAARQSVVLDPLDEAQHRQLMRFHLRLGARHSALQQYRRCQKVLKKELQIEPDQSTQALYRSIQACDTLGKHNLPDDLTPFVGREAEIKTIQTFLANATGSLFTLLGPGGIGKSRLAIAAARQQLEQLPGLFPDGVFFIELQGVQNIEGLIGSMAAALELEFKAQPSQQEQLLQLLKEKESLLILDNVEHLADKEPIMDWLGQLLGMSLAGKLLVTSRERLRLDVEQVMDVSGLDVPEPELSLSLDEAHQYGAPVLFMQHAQRVQTHLDWEQELGDVLVICRQVEGMPLALELAASHTRHWRCRQIQEQIQKDLDFLVNQSRSTANRHQSMRAVFGTTWRCLTPEEQKVFQGCCVFQCPFTDEAAAAVAQASPQILSNLVDKSLFKRIDNGCYSLHPLMGQFGWKKLSQIQRQLHSVQTRFVNYYSDLAKSLCTGIGSGDLSSVQQEMVTERHDDFTQALRWSVEIEDLNPIPIFVTLLEKNFSWTRQHGAKNLDFFLAIWNDISKFETQTRLVIMSLAYLALAIGKLYFYLNQTRDAQQWFTLANNYSKDKSCSHLQLESLYQLGVIFATHGNYCECKQIFNQMLQHEDLPSYYKKRILVSYSDNDLITGQFNSAEKHLELLRREIEISGDASGRLGIIYHLGQIFLQLRRGRFDRVRRLYRDLCVHNGITGPAYPKMLSQGFLLQMEIDLGHVSQAMELLRELEDSKYDYEDTFLKGFLYQWTGYLNEARFEHESMVECYKKSMECFERAQDFQNVPLVKAQLGLAYARSNQYQAADKFLENTIAQSSVKDNWIAFVVAWTAYGILRRQQKRYTEARDYFTKALQRALPDDDRVAALTCLTEWALLFECEQDYVNASRIARFLQDHPNARFFDRRRMKELIQRISDHESMLCESDAVDDDMGSIAGWLLPGFENPNRDECCEVEVAYNH